MQSFHVVVPSLPGFAFSGQPKRPGYGPKQMGEAVNTLMLKLGYNRYVAQGAARQHAVIALQEQLKSILHTPKICSRLRCGPWCTRSLSSSCMWLELIGWRASPSLYKRSSNG